MLAFNITTQGDNKKTKKICFIFGTSQSILLKSFLQHDSLGQDFVLQTKKKIYTVDNFLYLA